jgi:hypothetical protein
VALAAIQGLNQKLQAKATELDQLRRQNASLVQRLDELERAFRSLAASK